MNYFLHLMVYLSVYLMLAMSLNLVVGYTGLLTLAHSTCFAVGCYAYSILALRFEWSFLPALLLAGVIAAVTSLTVSLPAWRFKGDFFVVASLAVQALGLSVFYNWFTPGAELGSWANMTNGPFGISGVPKPNLFGISVKGVGGMAALASTIMVLSGLFCWILLKSPWGRALKAMRDDEIAARSLGKQVRRLKIQAFAISSGIAGVAGATLASYIGYVDPTMATLDQSILLLSMVLVGGVGNFRGPVIGAILLLALPEMLRFMRVPETVAPNLRLLVYGLLLTTMMHFRPQGIAGDYRIG